MSPQHICIFRERQWTGMQYRMWFMNIQGLLGVCAKEFVDVLQLKDCRGEGETSCILFWSVYYISMHSSLV